ncbi:MAG: response regulator [Gemmatimonadota bacterium]
MARILIIDDDNAVRRMLVRACSVQGHRVLDAPSWAGDIELLRKETLDLVITNIRMPHLDGIEIIKLLRDTGATAKVLAISPGGWTRPGEDVLLDARLLGADRVLQKPFTLQELNTTIEEMLSHT